MYFMSDLVKFIDFLYGTGATKDWEHCEMLQKHLFGKSYWFFMIGFDQPVPITVRHIMMFCHVDAQGQRYFEFKFRSKTLVHLDTFRDKTYLVRFRNRLLTLGFKQDVNASLLSEHCA